MKNTLRFLLFSFTFIFIFSSCEENMSDIENSQIEQQTSDFAERLTACDFNLDIQELVKASYPASSHRGKYKLTGYPSGANITWSINNGSIVAYLSDDEIYVEPDNPYSFSLTATVTSSGCTGEDTRYEVFYPQSAIGK